MSTKPFDLVPVNVDELQLSMLGFDIIDAQARLVHEYDEYDSTYEYEIYWSVRGRFDPEEWRDRFSDDWSPQLVPMIQVPELGKLSVVYNWPLLEPGERNIKISERRELLKSEKRIDVTTVAATVTAYDSARLDYDLVPITRGANLVPVDIVMEDSQCGCKPQIHEAHASLSRDDDNDDPSLQLFMVGSMELCSLKENRLKGRRRATHSPDHELPRLTVDVLDDTGFILDEKDYLVALRAQVSDLGNAAMRQPRWIYSEKTSLSDLISLPGRVVATFGGGSGW